MEKEFVNYNQALKLKALGFDEPCFAAYSEDEDVSNLFIYWNDLADMSELFISQDNCEKFNYECLAPTFSQSFRWFRAKYNVHSSPKKYDETKWWIEWGTWTGLVFETYEEAESAWLDKLIEIVKQKNEK